MNKHSKKEFNSFLKEEMERLEKFSTLIYRLKTEGNQDKKYKVRIRETIKLRNKDTIEVFVPRGTPEKIKKDLIKLFS